MGILEPQDLSSALLPILYFNWIIGIGMARPPRSKVIHFFMILHTLGFWVAYVAAFHIGISVMVPSYLYGNSPMAILMYQVIVYTNTCVSVIAPFLSWIRFKKLKYYVERVQKFDDILLRILGFEKNYRKIFIEQIYQLIMICFIIFAITIIDSTWFLSETSFFTNAAMMFTFHYPILLMLVIDCTFCAMTRWVARKFRDLNTSLVGLVEPDVASYPRGRLIVVEKKLQNRSSLRGIVNGEAWTSVRKRYLFQTIRKAHLELSSLAEIWNSAFGIQNLISMAVSSVLITGLLYTIYCAFYWKHTMYERFQEILPPASWCLIYAFKIFMISYTCASASDEAQKSGQIIYEILGSSSNQDLEKEIQEFALQMMQNPVRFTACGFFTLDHTYIQGVVGSVTTYLVILIQMSSTPSASTSSVNETTS